jgi:hypothetical protein
MTPEQMFISVGIIVGIGIVAAIGWAILQMWN